MIQKIKMQMQPLDLTIKKSTFNLNKRIHDDSIEKDLSNNKLSTEYVLSSSGYYSNSGLWDEYNFEAADKRGHQNAETQKQVLTDNAYDTDFSPEPIALNSAVSSYGNNLVVLDNEDACENRKSRMNVSSDDTFPTNCVLNLSALNSNTGNENNCGNDESRNNDKENYPPAYPTKRTRKRVREEKLFPDNVNKKSREEGKTYTGWQNRNGIRKRGTIRPKKEIGPSCNSEFCRSSNIRKCNEIDDNSRRQIHSKFWSEMSWDQKKVYITSLVLNKSPKRISQSSHIRKRTSSLVYSLISPDGKRMNVCSKLFTSTFSLNAKTIQRWTQKQSEIPAGIQTQKNKSNERKRSSKTHVSEEMKTLHDFLDKIPKLPSHYCRKDTKKLYIEPIYGNNVSQLYQEYKRFAESQKTKIMSRFTFSKVADDKNICFQSPKKDQCNICCSYNSGNLNKQDYERHIINKEASRSEKAADKIKAKNRDLTVISQDLQSVKVCPMTNASALYYKTKLCVHNFTIYDLRTRDTICYWFDETTADLSSNTFVSCVIDYLTKKCQNISEIVIWSDNCCYQNKNSVLANALLSFATEKKVTIFQKYLQQGHTQMEVDSVHARIEGSLRNKAIFVPADYCRYTKEARKINPYEANQISIDFVKNYDTEKKYDSIRPGRCSGDWTVNDIKVIKYTPDGLIEVKVNFDGDWLEVPLKRNALSMPRPLSYYGQLHKQPIKISRQKWKHLQELKSVIPRDFHSFYDNIEHTLI